MKSFTAIKCSLIAVVALVLACFAGSARADITVSTEAQLAALGNTNITENVNIVGKTYDMSSFSGWKPIKSLAQNCTINGNGAVIEGLNLGAVVSSNYCGFVGQNRGTIESLSIRTSANVTVPQNMGGIAAENLASGTIDNCIVYADSPNSVVITVGSNTKAGGIAGLNKGTISNCMVKNLQFVCSGVGEVGGIVGNNGGGDYDGAIESCYAYNVTIQNTNGGPGGRYGFIVGYNECGTINIANADGCSLSSDDSYIGGVTSYVDYDSVISNCWIKNCSVALAQNGSGMMGGLFGYVYDAGATSITSCYFGGGSASLTNNGTGIAGGLVGSFCTESFYRAALTNCFYETDAAPGITDMVGAYAGGDDSNLANCDGVTTSTMKGSGWAADNLGSGWIPESDGYPVYSDGNIRLVSISRPSKNNVSLNRNHFRLTVGDLNDMGYVSADKVIAVSDFQLVDLLQDGTSVTLDYPTVNGTRITSSIVAEDYATLDLSAKVTNKTADALQAKYDEYLAIYNRGRRMYTVSSLATLKTALDAANAALTDHYINITKTEADPLAAAIETASLDVMMCTLSFDAVDGVVNVNSGAAVNQYIAEKNTTVTLNAIPMSGYEFVCWKDSAGNLLGDDTSLEYTVFSTTTITAEFRPNSRYTFTYQDNYGKTYKIQPVADYSDVSYPAAVGAYLRTGYKVKSWDNDYPGGDLPSSGSVTGNVVFTATLGHDTADTFTVKYKPNAGAEWVEGTYKPGRVFRATADETYGGNAFSYWKDQNGNTVTYERELSVTVYAAMEFTPYYEGAQSGVTVANLQSAVANSSTGKIAFTGQVVFGDDFASEVYHRVLLLKSSSAVSSLDFNTSGVIVGKSSGYSAQTNTYIINKKNVAAGDTWYGRAFIVYYDTNNEMQIAFSDIKSATL